MRFSGYFVHRRLACDERSDIPGMHALKRLVEYVESHLSGNIMSVELAAVTESPTNKLMPKNAVNRPA